MIYIYMCVCVCMYIVCVCICTLLELEINRCDLRHLGCRTPPRYGGRQGYGARFMSCAKVAALQSTGLVQKPRKSYRKDEHDDKP